MSRERVYLLAASLFLAVGTFAVYSPVLGDPFTTLDDHEYVTGNLHVQAGLTRQTVAWAFTSIEQANWHPLTWISHALDCQLFGLEPAGHHFTNLLLHVCNVVLLFVLGWAATRKMGRSFLVAGLFAFHPFNVESVAWVAERKNVLSMFFLLLTLGAYGYYARKPSLGRYLLVALMFALGLAAKPMVITLPFVLLLLDFWPLVRVAGSAPAARDGSRALSPQTRRFSQASFSRLIVEKIPLFVLSAASAVITMIAQRAGASMQGSFQFSVRLENAIYAYAAYLWKTLVPSGFAIFYPHPGNTLEPARVAAAAIVLAGISFSVWKFRSSRPYLIIGWLWYLGTLVPMIGLVQVGNQAMADRYAYLPLIGIFLMLIWGISDLADRNRLSMDLRAALAGVLIFAALPYLTWRQVGYWADNDALWGHAAEVTRDNYLALMMLNRADEALPGLQRAVAQNPGDAMLHVKLATVFCMLAQPQQGISEFEAALQATTAPNVRARIYASMASPYADLGDFAKVRQSYQQALQTDPREGPEMLQRLAVFVQDQPSGSRYTQYGILLEACGKIDEARAAYEQAIQLDPDLAFARQSLSSLEIQEKK